MTPKPPRQTNFESQPTRLVWQFENVVFDEAAGQLWVDGQTVPIEPKPLRVLSELLQHANEVVTKEELFDVVWEGRPTVENVLPTAVNRLRKAMGEQAARRIVNLPRMGYRFDGLVRRIATPHTSGEAPALIQPGAAVPGKDSHVLVRALGDDPRSRAWLARHNKLGNERAF